MPLPTSTSGLTGTPDSKTKAPGRPIPVAEANQALQRMQQPRGVADRVHWATRVESKTGCHSNWVFPYLCTPLA